MSEHLRNELTTLHLAGRHNTNAETRYWCQQWRQFADKAVTDYATLTAEVDSLRSQVYRLTVELAEARAECLEQARLNGIGAERELRLMSERDSLRDECEAMARELTLHRSGYAFRSQTESLEQCRQECERLREALTYIANTLETNPDKLAEIAEAALSAGEKM